MKIYSVCRRCKRRKRPSAKRLCSTCIPAAATRRIRTYARCRVCGAPKSRNGQDTCTGCRFQTYSKRWEWRRKRRDLVLAHYGGRCVCCGESERAFLQIDHVAGGGRAHRKTITGGNFVFWLIRNGLPPGYRVLCANCNFAIARNPHCPHNPTIKTEHKVIPIRRA